ncbi:LOW QUALITY PROTEIN: THO complex subunit 1-like [Pecten maximus]|uniref:LOW QUALITY PROTEIN: THO complex subunit 1-like n=1 Tax=Pecten maximus TaxID=6579 RepID=UPI0014581DEC|nr:LOW QUALITY PROTEIN: THO complex subunit 1-like [Pecten maximus]
MAASMMFEFGKARNDFKVLVEKTIKNQTADKYVADFRSYSGGDTEKKLAMDQALRDVMHTSVTSRPDYEMCRSVINAAIELATQEACAPSTPFLLLSDVFDIITLSQCEELFCLVEDRLSTWKSETFYTAGKNYLLRMCNDLLRRLSKSQNTVFCGRIQLFLSRLFPLSEKSALNLMSQFNLENVTTYTTKADRFETELKGDGMEVEEGETEDHPKPVDYNLYRRFWALQDFFRKPTQCYEKVPWKMFQMNSDEVLNAFNSAKLDDMKSSRKKLAMPRPADTPAFFAKYLTSEKLMDLQLNDSNFRRYVLVQFLILFQYLNSQVKFKGSNQTLTDEQSQWVKNTQEKVYQLIRETPPEGEQFASNVEHILSREEYWNEWKNDGCPSYEREKSTDSKQRTKAKRRWVGDDLQASGGKIIKMGSSELTRLWNINPNNMGACRAEKRLFLPTLEDYFAEAMDQADPEAMVEDEYKMINEQIFQWKSLRLLARRSPHFFTHTNKPAIPLSEYLEAMLNKIAKEIPQTANNEEMKTEIGEEEEAIQERQEMEEQNDEQGKENTEDNLTPPMLDQLAAILKGEWKKLATELNFPEDDISYFETESSDEKQQALKMLTVWHGNEGDRATVGTLKIALKEVGLTDAIQSVFGKS